MAGESYLICKSDLISEPGSFGFSLKCGEEIIDGFVVQNDGCFYAYRNSCPHTGSPLDWVEHQFLDMDGSLIQCAVHDARFIIETGECIMGPCAGECLEKIDIRIESGNIYLYPDSI